LFSSLQLSETMPKQIIVDNCGLWSGWYV